MSLLGSGCDIHGVIISYLDPICNYPWLCQVNHYFYQLIKRNDQYKMLAEVFKLSFTDSLVIEACVCNMSIVLYLMKPCQDNKYCGVFETEELNNGLEECCERGHISLMKDIIMQTDREIDYKYLFNCCCKYDRLEMIVWFVDNKLDVCQESAIRHACANGHLRIVKYLLEVYQNFNIHYDDERLFATACIMGHVNVAEYLIELGHQPKYGEVDIHVNIDSILRNCLKYGIEITEWFLSLCHGYHFQFINTVINNMDTVFEYFCRKGNLEVAKYLFELRYRTDINLVIDIHANGEEAFIIACRYRNLDIVKWLIEISQQADLGLIDLNAGGFDGNSNAIMYARMNSHEDVLEYLLELSNYYPIQDR